MHAISRSHGGARRQGVRWWQVDVADSDAVDRVVRTCDPRPPPPRRRDAGGQGAGPRAADVPDEPRGHGQRPRRRGRAGCRRVVLTGSLEEPAAGGDPPSSPYAASKWAGSAYARMFHAIFGVPVVGLRVFMVCTAQARPSCKSLSPTRFSSCSAVRLQSFRAGEEKSIGSTLTMSWTHSSQRRAWTPPWATRSTSARASSFGFERRGRAHRPSGRAGSSSSVWRSEGPSEGAG